MQKRELKNIQNSQSYDEKSDFDPPFWIDPPFFLNMAQFHIFLCSDTKYKLNAKEILAGYREKPITILAAILDFRRHIGFDKKLFFYKICLILTETKNWKRNVKMLQTHRVIVENLHFRPFWKMTPSWKLMICTRQFFFQMKALIIGRIPANKKKIKNTLF